MNRILWRWRNQIYALAFGFFWLPCPICGEYYGGHESTDGMLMDSWDGGQGVCYKKSCVVEANRRNDKFMRDNPAPVHYTMI